MVPYLLTPSAVCFVLLTVAATLAGRPKEERKQSMGKVRQAKFNVSASEAHHASVGLKPRSFLGGWDFFYEIKKFLQFKCKHVFQKKANEDLETESRMLVSDPVVAVQNTSCCCSPYWFIQSEVSCLSAP